MALTKVRLHNISPVSQTLSGVAEVEPGRWVDVPFEIAARYRHRRLSGLYFDFEGLDGSYRFKDESGRITHLAYRSMLDPYEGYGVCGIHFIRAALQHGLTLSLPVEQHEWEVQALEEHYPEILPVVRGPKHPCLWGIVHGVPGMFDQLAKRGVPNTIGHTMFETDRLPDEWVAQCNGVAALIVPSTVQRTIFQQSGVTVPIHVVGDPIDLEAFPYQPRPERGPVFRFFTYGRLSARKMPLETIECFRRAFGDRADVHLTLKTIKGSWGGPLTDSGLPPLFQPYPNVTVYNELWSVERLRQEIQASDCAIFLSRGEGQMNPPLQCFAAGLPVICSDHTGLADYATDAVCYPVRTRGSEPCPTQQMWGSRGNWWVPDLDHCVALLQRVVERPNEVRRKLPKARRLVEARYSLRAHFTGMLEVVDAVASSSVAA